MADDWCGFNSTVESLRAQWKIWVDYALASGSPIGVEDLEKTVVTAGRWDGKKWVDVKVVLEIPHGEGGMTGLPEVSTWLGYCHDSRRAHPVIVHIFLFETVASYLPSVRTPVHQILGGI